MASYNQGKCTLVAHNSGRYDTRLLFDQVLRMRVSRQNGSGHRDIKPPTIVMRGNNFLKLQIDKLLFIDSINHLPGSLRNLGRDYAADSECVKGYFPYTFNTEANWNYIGQIPGLEYFDVSLNERDEFMEWYNQASRYPWSLQRELELYCKQDVKVLANIVKSYHLICCKENYNMSPWQYLTAPSYVHQCYLRNITMTMELPDPKDDRILYNSICEEKAENYWAVIPANVHNFAKQALRGGRTDVKTFHAELTLEEIAQGVRFRYVDVVSLYPYQQAVHKFPVGLPTIYIYNKDYTPCISHQGMLKCGCFHKELPYDIQIENDPELTSLDILNDPSFFGIICATVEPPKTLFHPILPVYDYNTLKCTFPLTTITEGIFTSIEFKKALEYGYRLIRVHRYDKYKAADSLWADKIKDQYMQKMINSRNKPSPEEHQRLVEEYETKFDMGEELKKAYNQDLWGKRPAIKQAYKTMVNCAWGKHAERKDRDQVYISGLDGCESMQQILENHHSGLSSVRITQLDDRHDLIKVKNDLKQVQPDLSGAYLPCAVFVPAYGRLQLWEELNKLGKRVLYHDTDSIIYKASVTGEYNIPESDIWGEWEREDVDVKNGGIIEFVSAGPKSYAFKCKDGPQVLKTKGVSLGPKTQEIFNFDVMKELVLQGIEMNQAQIVQIPQRQFLYKVGQGIFTVNMLKKIGFNPEHVKGFIGPDKRHYPQGYTGNIG